QEAAGAVGVLRLAGLEASLAEERGLLVADSGSDRQRAAEQRCFRFAEHAARWHDLRQHGARDVEQAKKFIVPIAGAQVEEQRAAGVARVGGMDAAAGEAPDEECVDGAEEDLALGGASAQARLRIEQMFDLGAGEIGIEQQAGALAEERLVAVLLQALAD